jgi:hypothetical protein
VSNVSSAPGSSLAAQLREARAQERRRFRNLVESIREEIREEKRNHAARLEILERDLKTAEAQLQDCLDRLSGKKPQITFNAQEGEQ